MTKVLVLAAHPDDEVLGCGATIAKLADEGADVVIGILGEGSTSRSPSRDSAGDPHVEVLREQSRAAAEILRAREVVHLGLPDNRFDSVDLLDVVKEVEQLLSVSSAEIVITQHGGDLNIDHQVLFRAAMTATRPVPGQRVREVLAFEVASSTEWAFGRFAPSFRASTFVDVSTTLERKIEALAVYESEVRPFPHPRSPESLRAQATRWGSTVGVSAAEAFDLVWRRW